MSQSCGCSQPRQDCVESFCHCASPVRCRAMSDVRFQGKPPKSPEQIRRILKSIHAANESYPSGPYVKGLPKSEVSVIRTHAACHLRAYRHSTPRELRRREAGCGLDSLIRRGGLVGGTAGLLFGLNLGFAISIVIGNAWLFAAGPVVLSLICCARGFTVGRLRIVESRQNLFVNCTASRW